MPSNSLHQWTGTRAAALDEIAEAHRQVGGTSPGRRFATQQINRAYALLLSSEFQGFCRDLYFESVEPIVSTAPKGLQSLIRDQFLHGIQLGRGNPHAGAIGSDFNRLGFQFWGDVDAHHPHGPGWRREIDDLVRWRNAIAHNDFRLTVFGPNPTLRLDQVRRWRRSLDNIAMTFDRVLMAHLNNLLGSSPWPA